MSAVSKIEPRKSPTIKPPEAAEILGISVDTLARWRCQGFGPTFHKMGRAVRYDREAVEAWKASRKVSSTSEADAYKAGS